jgi:uncharacterized protein
MHYFDTSFIAPLFLEEDKSRHVEDILQSVHKDRVVSHWLRVEFSSLISRLVRMKSLNKSQALQIAENFENLILESFYIITPSVADFNLATSLLQQSKAGLRAGDALHLAMAQNHGAKRFYTLDQGLEKATTMLTSLTVVT